ncbi:hypothetical protein ACKWRH_05470 [Bradyrhizobium sp. Pa8]|uniref:hypothetical protein n=1 Tax=Bradyrhizobium sp. Pa8 TaxID=3386552 RepID=UPI00403F1282
MIHCRVHGSFHGRLYAGALYDGVQEVRHLDVKSAELGVIGPDGMEMTAILRDGNFAFLCADAFRQFAARALERRTSLDNGRQDIRGRE